MHERDALAQRVRGGFEPSRKGGPFPDGRYGGRSPMYCSHSDGQEGYIEKFASNGVKVDHVVTLEEKARGVLGSAPGDRRPLFLSLKKDGVLSQLQYLERLHGMGATSWGTKEVLLDESGRVKLTHKSVSSL